MRAEESGNSFYLVSLLPFAPNSQLCFWEETLRERQKVGEWGWGGEGRGNDKIRTEWGSDITQREMKERESETESWCWSLSKKTLFLSLSLCFFWLFWCVQTNPQCVDGETDTTQQMKRVSWWLEAHTCCLSFFLLPNCILVRSLRSIFCLTVSPTPSCFSCRSELEISHLPDIWLPEPFAHSHSCPYLGCEESPVSSVLNCYLIIL